MIKLQELVGALEMQNEEAHACYDKRTEQIVMHSSELDSLHGEGAGHLPEWQKEQAELNRLIEEDEEAACEDDKAGQRRFIPLPDRFEIDEWRMMEEFAAARDDDSHADELLRAIQGRGAFRYFKDTAHRLGLAEEWYAFREERYRQIAREFCQEHGIAFRE